MRKDIPVSANIFVSVKTIMSNKLAKINWKIRLLQIAIEKWIQR